VGGQADDGVDEGGEGRGGFTGGYGHGHDGPGGGCGAGAGGHTVVHQHRRAGLERDRRPGRPVAPQLVVEPGVGGRGELLQVVGGQSCLLDQHLVQHLDVVLGDLGCRASPGRLVATPTRRLRWALPP